MSQYALMHKNDVCGSLVIDDETGSLRVYKDNGSGLSPFLGNANTGGREGQFRRQEK